MHQMILEGPHSHVAGCSSSLQTLPDRILAPVARSLSEVPQVRISGFVQVWTDPIHR